MQSGRRTAARPGDTTSRLDSADPGLLATRAWQPVTVVRPDGEKARSGPDPAEDGVRPVGWPHEHVHVGPVGHTGFDSRGAPPGSDQKSPLPAFGFLGSSAFDLLPPLLMQSQPPSTLVAV